MKDFSVAPSEDGSLIELNRDSDFYTAETDFGNIVKKLISRREILSECINVGAAALLFSGASIAPLRALSSNEDFSFEAIDANTLDTVTVPIGFSWHVVVKWGDPMWSNSPIFDEKTRGTAQSQKLAFGDNNDGMAFFTTNNRHLLAVNNEYVNAKIIYGESADSRPKNTDDIRKAMAGHGISIIEIEQINGVWSTVIDSPFNRRITPDTPMKITGPAKGDDLMKTKLDPTGSRCLGTWNNCGNGRTPWGTYLSCEENFNGYFSSTDPTFEVSAEHKRYGIGLDDWGCDWAAVDERFDICRHPNEPNRAGYIVEIDPFDPESVPNKRTALGRFKHENAEVVISKNGQVVVYMGDDERGEFLYKFVSSGFYVEGGENRNLLENGSLYAAKFDVDGTGQWLELTLCSTKMKTYAEIFIKTRQAASTVGATTMDRPEWVAVNPNKVEAYCCLTNNKHRGIRPNAGGDATPIGGPNPRKQNKYGQIVRWVPNDEDHLSNSFTWDLFVVAGNPAIHQGDDAGSKNVDISNMFNSPDGLAFDRNGLLWIQTDGDYSNRGDFAGHGNNQMLVAYPATGHIFRFLVGPCESEVTGITWSTNRKTLFVGIQHPGERGNSHFPDGGNRTPRSAIIAVTRDDDGLMG